MKKTCIFFSIPLFGHVNSSLPLFKQMISKGYKVYYLSDEKFRVMIEGIGATFIPYTVDLKKYLTGDIGESLLKIYSTKLQIDNIMFEEAVSFIDSISPDFIMHDSMAGFAKYAAIRKRVKAINIITTLALNPFVFLSTFSVVLPIIKLLVTHPLQLAQLTLNGFKTKQNYKFSQFPLTDPFVNEEALNILFTPSCFQPQSFIFSKRYFFARPTIDERIYFNDIEFEYNFKNTGKKPLIYVSLGTIVEDGSKMERKLSDIISVLSKQNANIIISLGNLENIEIGNNDNIKIVKFVNQLEVLKRTDLFINHGGLNSVYEAIWFKVPQICIPSQTEQLVTAKIVARKQCGICIKKFSPKKLDKSIDMLLDKSGKLHRNVKASLSLLSNEFINSPSIDEIIHKISEYLEC